MFDPAAIDPPQFPQMAGSNTIGPGSGGLGIGVSPPAVPNMRLGNVLFPPTALAAAFTVALGWMVRLLTCAYGSRLTASSGVAKTSCPGIPLIIVSPLPAPKKLCP